MNTPFHLNATQDLLYLAPTLVHEDTGVLLAKKGDAYYAYYKGVKLGYDATDASKIHEHFFFEGQMFKSKELFEMFAREFATISFASNSFQGYVCHPIWNGATNVVVNKTSVAYSDPYFFPPERIVYLKDNAISYFMEGNFVPLYIKKVYSFKISRCIGVAQLSSSESRKHWKKHLVSMFGEASKSIQ